MCERQPCIAESLCAAGQGRCGPWRVHARECGQSAPVAHALALIISDLRVLIRDRSVEEVAHAGSPPPPKRPSTRSGRPTIPGSSLVSSHQHSLLVLVLRFNCECTTVTPLLLTYLLTTRASKQASKHAALACLLAPSLIKVFVFGRPTKLHVHVLCAVSFRGPSVSSELIA